MSSKVRLRPRPLERKVLDPSRHFHLFHRPERTLEDSPLHLPVPRPSHDLPERMLHRREARHAHCGRQIRYVRQGNRRKAGFLYLPRDQSDEPATRCSSRHQYHDIHFICPKAADHLRNTLPQELPRIEDIPHERIMPPRREPRGEAPPNGRRGRVWNPRPSSDQDHLPAERPIARPEPIQIDTAGNRIALAVPTVPSVVLHPGGLPTREDRRHQAPACVVHVQLHPDAPRQPHLYLRRRIERIGDVLRQNHRFHSRAFQPPCTEDHLRPAGLAGNQSIEAGFAARNLSVRDLIPSDARRRDRQVRPARLFTRARAIDLICDYIHLIRDIPDDARPPEPRGTRRTTARTSGRRR